MAVPGRRVLPVRDVRLPTMLGGGEVRDLPGLGPRGRRRREDEQGGGEHASQEGKRRRMSGPGHFDLLNSCR